MQGHQPGGDRDLGVTQKAAEKGLEDMMAGPEWGWRRIWHGPGERNAFLCIVIPLIAPCCSQPSPIRTGSLCLIAKLFSSPLTPLPTLYGPLS